MELSTRGKLKNSSNYFTLLFHSLRSRYSMRQLDISIDCECVLRLDFNSVAFLQFHSRVACFKNWKFFTVRKFCDTFLTMIKCTTMSRNFLIYISIISLIVVNNCTLTYFAVPGRDTPVQVFAYAALIPSIVYLVETFVSRDALVEFLREIKDIKRSFVPGRQKNVAFVSLLSTRDSVKIIFAFMIFIFQMVIVFVRCLSEEIINYDT